jgi:hypothetical protein
VFLPDLLIANLSLPYYSNSTLIRINISNLGPPPVYNVNVSCYLNNVIFDSKLIGSIAGNNSYMTNCTTILVAGNNQVLNVTVDPDNSIEERDETNNFYVLNMNVTQIANISINTLSTANTTDTININGLIIGNDGTSLPNLKFTIKLNNAIVSSDTSNHSDFASGTPSGVNITDTVQLNLSKGGDLINYADHYTTSSYKTDSHVINYSNEGWYSDAGGNLFWLNSMSSNSGNITYKFDSVTNFYNATAYIETYTPSNPPGANTSLWYSFDNVTWSILASTIDNGTIIGGEIPDIRGKTIIYIKINSDTFGGTKETPVTRFELNYTDYSYPNSGNFISPSINLPNVTYTILKWDQQ